MSPAIPSAYHLAIMSAQNKITKTFTLPKLKADGSNWVYIPVYIAIYCYKCNWCNSPLQISPRMFPTNISATTRWISFLSVEKLFL